MVTCRYTYEYGYITYIDNANLKDFIHILNDSLQSPLLLLINEKINYKEYIVENKLLPLYRLSGKNWKLNHLKRHLR